MKIAKVIVLLTCAAMVLLAGFGCNRHADKPGETLLVSQQLRNPIHDSQVELYGNLLCPRLVLTFGGKSIEAWYNLMTSENRTLWPTISLDKFRNSDFLIVTGELKSDVKDVTWAVIIDKAE